MSNANFEPMPFVRSFGGSKSTPAPPPQQFDATDYVDALGQKIFKPAASGACRKCGFVGHLPYQCRNFIQLEPGRSAVIDVSSTSSESDGETPLVKIEKARKKLEKKLKKEKKKQAKKEKKKRKKKYDSDSSDEEDKKKRKRKKKRKHSSSSNSDDSSNEDKKKKRKHKRKRRSSSSTDSPDDRKRRRRSPSYD